MEIDRYDELTLVKALSRGINTNEKNLHIEMLTKYCDNAVYYTLQKFSEN